MGRASQALLGNRATQASKHVSTHLYTNIPEMSDKYQTKSKQIKQIPKLLQKQRNNRTNNLRRDLDARFLQKQASKIRS